MSYYEYDTGYYEPSEFEEQCEQLKETLKRSAWKDLTERIEQLEKEVTELKPYKEKKIEVDTIRRECELKVAQAENKAKEMRIKELFGEHWITAYRINTAYIEQPKCNKCNDRREIEYITPLGRKAKEYCTCAAKQSVYSVRETECLRFYINRNTKIEKYYEPRNGDYDSFDMLHYIYDGKPFDTATYYGSTVFLNKEDCQKCCDFLNEKERAEESRRSQNDQ